MLHLLFIWTDVVLAAGLALLSRSSLSGQCAVSSISNHINQVLAADDVSMEAYPFKVGDYNKEVQKNYPGEKGLGMSLQYADDVIAYIVIYDDKDHAWNEAPQVLNREFLKIKEHYAGSCFNTSSFHFIEANEMHTTAGGLRLPIVHTQTAGHVAGGAHYYQRHHVGNEPASWADKTIYGLSAHKDFGLDTRFSGVIVFEELRDPSFVSPSPTDVARTDKERIKLLNEYNAFGY